MLDDLKCPVLEEDIHRTSRPIASLYTEKDLNIGPLLSLECCQYRDGLLQDHPGTLVHGNQNRDYLYICSFFNSSEYSFYYFYFTYKFQRQKVLTKKKRYSQVIQQVLHLSLNVRIVTYIGT